MLRQFVVGLVLLGLIPAVIGTSFAQTNEAQVTISGDLSNNPAAQDILKKIEQTKKWIAELEKKNFERQEAQKELEKKRELSLASLQRDLKAWENVWEQFSSKNAFKKFVSDKPEGVQGIFWDQFDFKESKVKAGREALKQVLNNGGSMKQAREAYHKAAESKIIELIEANKVFNVKHNLAIHNQQVLFNSEGQFIETKQNEAQLHKYFEDYRTNPAYLKVNPNDVSSWESMQKTNPNTQCRDGFLVVYRYQSEDYVCVTSQTAEIWLRYDMGYIPNSN